MCAADSQFPGKNAPSGRLSTDWSGNDNAVTFQIRFPYPCDDSTCTPLPSTRTTADRFFRAGLCSEDAPVCQMSPVVFSIPFAAVTLDQTTRQTIQDSQPLLIRRSRRLSY